MTERTLVHIGDDCTLNESSTIQCHSQEDGSFKSDYSTLGSNVTLGTAAHVHYGVTIGDGVVLAPDSFLMKGEEVPPYAHWGGNPASEMRVPAAPGRSPAREMPVPAVPGENSARETPVPAVPGRNPAREAPVPAVPGRNPAREMPVPAGPGRKPTQRDAGPGRAQGSRGPQREPKRRPGPTKQPMSMVSGGTT